MLRHAGVGGDVNVPYNLLTLMMLRHVMPLFSFFGFFLESYFVLYAYMSPQVRRSECCGTGRQSYGLSVAQHLLESECNLETGDHVGWSSGYVLLTYICRDAYKQIAVLIHYIYIGIFFNGYDINLSI